MLERYKFRFNKLSKKEIMVAAFIDWNWVEDLGLNSQVEPLLTKVHITKNCLLICNGWERLFKTHEPILRSYAWNSSP